MLPHWLRATFPCSLTIRFPTPLRHPQVLPSSCTKMHHTAAASVQEILAQGALSASGVPTPNAKHAFPRRTTAGAASSKSDRSICMEIASRLGDGPLEGNARSPTSSLSFFVTLTHKINRVIGPRGPFALTKRKHSHDSYVHRS